jgi:hypothetical protein
MLGYQQVQEPDETSSCLLENAGDKIRCYFLGLNIVSYSVLIEESM